MIMITKRILLLLTLLAATAPLKVPEGAVVIDTTHLDLDGVIAAVLSRLGTLQELGPAGK
ncbi:MAG: hypothetical protein EBR40_03735 [Proteobacteria bacterium]|nr:hypothetical protein [Pseudomonadota bacterium]